jgi:predicted Zn finger-like uncharacterized protein
MALATRCPHCSALFRVGAEQLRSHNGMVRCGSCRKVFNAIGRLDYVEPGAMTAERGAARAGKATDAPPPPFAAQPAAAAPAPLGAGTRAAAPRAAQAKPATPAVPAPSISAPARTAPPAAATPMTAPARAARPLAAPSSGAHSPGGPPTLFDADVPSVLLAPPGPPADASNRREAEAPRPMVLASGPPTEPGADEGPAPSFDTVFATPVDTDAPNDTESEDAAQSAPTFLRETPPARVRAIRRALGGASALLALLFLAQVTLLFRADLMARAPELRPLVSALCAPFSCSAQWPMRPEYLSVLSSEMHPVPGTPALELVAVVRNRAEFPIALPAIELKLTDTQERTVGRKVFLPEAYLANSPPEARAENIGAGADLSVRLVFEFPGGHVDGFETYPFYP